MGWAKNVHPTTFLRWRSWLSSRYSWVGGVWAWGGLTTFILLHSWHDSLDFFPAFLWVWGVGRANNVHPTMLKLLRPWLSYITVLYVKWRKSRQMRKCVEKKVFFLFATRWKYRNPDKTMWNVEEMYDWSCMMRSMKTLRIEKSAEQNSHYKTHSDVRNMRIHVCIDRATLIGWLQAKPQFHTAVYGTGT